MFLYCNNNPVCYVDTNGESVTLAFGAALLAEALFDVSLTLVFAKIVYDVATEISDLFNQSSGAKSSQQDSKQKSKDKDTDGEVKTGVPPTEDDGYVAPKGGAKKGKGKNGENGWVDDKGNVWVPAPTGSSKAHGGGHWDVQRKDGKGYINVYPGGNYRPGKGKPPILPIIKIFFD